MAGIIDIQAIGRTIKEIFLTVARIPFELWYGVNPWIKLGIIIFIALISFMIALIVLKNLEKWKEKRF